jgi:Spondin_N
MKNQSSFNASLLCLVTFAPMTMVNPALADERLREGVSYEVKITNLTRGQQFTPILAAAHMPSVSLFQLGQSASSELATLAEEGNVAPLTAVLRANKGVLEVVNGAGLTEPGATTTLTVSGRGGAGADRISVAAMLIPTNDTFFAVNGVALPRLGEALAFTVPAYDSGSERNDELCASIPGPFFAECNGSGGGAAPSGGEEGFVHISAGMHGIGSFTAAARDWRNPVARITIRRIR